MEGHGAGGALPGMRGAGSKVGERGVGAQNAENRRSVNLLELIVLYRIDFYEP